MKHSVFICTLFATLIFGIGILIFVLPMKEFSETENRPLAELPSFDLEEFFEGSTVKQVGKFYADRFPMRIQLLRLKSSAELLSLGGENGKVFFGKDMYLVKRLDTPDLDILAQNQKKVDQIIEKLSKDGKPTVTVYAPRAIDVLGSKLPSLYPSEKAAMVYDILPKSPLTDILQKKSARGDRVWYRTDHHWSTLGAYTAYVYLGEVLGYSPYPPEAFRRETVSESFFGSSAAASLFPVIRPDSITLYRFADDESLVLTDMSTGEMREGLYDFEKLKTPDGYGVFLGGNFAHIRIEAPFESRPLLLIIKDSYANALVPFLARHFNMEMIDPRYLRVPSADLLSEIIGREEYAGALFLMNIETLSGNAGLDMLLPSFTS